MAGQAKSAAGPAGQSASGAGEISALLPLQNIIYTASLTLAVSNVTAAATQASNDVTAAGGYIAGEQQTAPGGKHEGAKVSLQLKIPVAAYQATLAKLTALGKPVSFSTEAQDVTQQVADVNSRVASAKAAITQLRALLRRAGNVSALLSVQDEINAQESDLESLLAQQQALDHETSYATVTLQVTGRKAASAPGKKASHGLVAGLGAGWRALKLVVGWLLTAIGAVLPFAIPLAVIGCIVYAGRRRQARRRKSQPAGTA